ncbi:hypothetical protein JWS13_14405 [Rhodococcus pseudokoreensis]|uniref:Uncharacterized protein n=1 Tax=Rhodococcus pseudokoreensis TaxID=2811421 RepID=A0A974W1X5_9NOCA|nr:hypothetical protein [Rhodococcus pseudokoreensis]QSE89738.1 hypothetical protein JWS13_14405 [Rhodococcus pseudokoreensis]
MPTAVFFLATGIAISSLFLSSPAEGNYWKYGLGVASILMLLALIHSAPVVVQISAATGVAGVSLAYETRSLALISLLSAAIPVVHLIFRKSQSRALKRAGVLLCLPLSYLVIDEILRQIASGRFGEVLADRQSSQLSRDGLLGGRPEYSAFVELVKRNPFGFGLGIRPSFEDITAGKVGLMRVGMDTSGWYVNRRMFGTAVELHSVAWDLWVQISIFGFALAAIFLVCYLRTMLALWNRTSSHGIALGLFVVFNGLWDLAFSPLYANYYVLAVGVATCLYINQGSDRRNLFRSKYRLPRSNTDSHSFLQPVNGGTDG